MAQAHEAQEAAGGGAAVRIPCAKGRGSCVAAEH